MKKEKAFIDNKKHYWESKEIKTRSEFKDQKEFTARFIQKCLLITHTVYTFYKNVRA